MHYLPELLAPELERKLQAWKDQHPALGLLVLLPEAAREQVHLVQASCARLGVPVVGALFPALISDHRFVQTGALLLGFERMPYWVLHDQLPTESASIDSYTTELAQKLRAQLDNKTESTLFMLFDAMVPHIGTLLDAIYLKLANRVHYAGANAGSETFQPMPCLFDGERLIGNGALFLLLQPHHGAIVEHGYAAPEQTVYATSTEGNRIAQIDWRPAFGVYQSLVQRQFGIEITGDNFYELAVHYPFGIMRANHHVLVRIPVALGDDGSLFCVGEIPPNSLLTLLERPAVDSRQTLDLIEKGLKQLNGSLDSNDLLLFYCAGRRMHMGVDHACEEIAALEERLPGQQVLGALSLGEIGGSTTWGYPLFHNATLVSLLWPGA